MGTKNYLLRIQAEPDYRQWRAALQRRTENFIRPLYWEKPMPDPPEELGHLHFAYYPLGG